MSKVTAITLEREKGSFVGYDFNVMQDQKKRCSVLAVCTNISCIIIFCILTLLIIITCILHRIVAKYLFW